MPPRRTDNEKARASARYVRVAPNKVRQVAVHIRGLDVTEAQNVLRFSPKGAAEPVLKTLNSAIANAENNLETPFGADELIVTSAVVDEGPMLKRFQPRAMGRAYRVRKRTSHITVAVGTAEGAGARRAGQQEQREGGRVRRALSRRRRESAAQGATPAAPAEETQE
jgi:large subunit ribosomal protein L22